MKILYMTLARIGDRSFGGAMRANYIYDALREVAEVETLVIHGGPTFSLDEQMDDRGIRTALISRWGLSIGALRQRALLKRWIASAIRLGSYDLIVAQYVGIAGLVPAGERDRLIFDADDFVKSAVAGTRQSPADRLKLRVRNLVARRLARQALHVWYSNPTPEHSPPSERKSWLPNVVALPDAERLRLSPTPGRVLMVGFFSHKPNIDGLRWFCTNVWPDVLASVPEAKLHAVGRYEEADAASLPCVNFLGYVPDLPTAYDEAALVIAPVISGGGTQIKVIDALAHGQPTLVSSFAHAGFADDLHDGEHLLVASSPQEWIERCIWALRSPEQIATVAERGEAIVRRIYGSERLKALVKDTIIHLRQSASSRSKL
ncbi:glycosyltransferase [uncultured Sphingomonas sp.]|uniref:glycosyltransferase n=1 Tax=uncultured Sphingomonas sp. TaxID=158754 RepID=UPI0035CB2FB1